MSSKKFDLLAKLFYKLKIRGCNLHSVKNLVNSSLYLFLKRLPCITLNVCPQSNLVLGIVDDIREHPIRELLQKGLLVTKNSDDFSLFGKSVSDQFINLYASGVCSEDDISQIIDNGIRQSLI